MYLFIFLTYNMGMAWPDGEGEETDICQNFGASNLGQKKKMSWLRWLPFMQGWGSLIQWSPNYFDTIYIIYSF